MSNEDLLKPRYKVIADYPDSTFSIGDVLMTDVNSFFRKHCLLGYPAIFRKPEWWEEREEKDMPEYVKIIGDDDNEIIIKVFGYQDGRIVYKNGGGTLLHYALPYTKEEYDNQQSKINKP